MAARARSISSFCDGPVDVGMSHTVQKDELDHAGLHLFIIFVVAITFSGSRPETDVGMEKYSIRAWYASISSWFTRPRSLHIFMAAKGTDRNTVTVKHRKIL